MSGVYVGLDIGGTKFLVAAVDESGRILEQIRENTPVNLDEGIALLQKMIKTVTDGERIISIGAAVGGPLDWKMGVVSPLHQPTWRDVPLKAMMEDFYGCPFWVDVDTNIAALGEYHSLNKPPKRLLYLTISTGMGGGYVIEGKVYRGLDGAHPEVGHQSINFNCSHPERVTCECGAPDCLEALISGNGIRRIYGKPAENLGTGEWEEVGFNLGQGLRNLAAIYLPDSIVLGGGVAIGGGDQLLKTAREVMISHIKLLPVPDVRLSSLGSETALVGALTAARLGVRE